MKNLNKYFKLCAERKAVEVALEAYAPKSKKHFWVALTNDLKQETIVLAVMSKDRCDTAAIVDINIDGLFIFRKGRHVVPPTAEMVDELNEWIEDRS